MFSSCSSKNGSSAVDLEVTEFVRLIEEGNVQLVDVRTASEFAQGHIAGAVNIDVKSAEFASQVEAQLKHHLPIALYCRSGARSAMAAKELRSLGFEGKIYNLVGGYLAYSSYK